MLALFLLVSLAPAQALSVGDVPYESIERSLEQKRQHYEVAEQSFLQALSRLASEAKVPMGIEWIDSPAALKPVHLTFTNASFAEILHALLKSQGTYESEVSKLGIVHVFPRGALEDGTSFLNLYVKKFEVRNENVAFASYRLRTKIQEMINPPNSFSIRKG